jgi:hypothetical protein
VSDLAMQAGRTATTQLPLAGARVQREPTGTTATMI